MIMTPGGQRCRECANLRPAPAYDVRALAKIRAALVAMIIGVVGGVAWWALLFILRSPLILILLAAGLGFLMAKAIERATNFKRGYVLQVIAGFGILLAYFVRNLCLRGDMEFVIIGDIYGYIAVAVAVVVAISPLR
jgi:hypothetical protein